MTDEKTRAALEEMRAFEKAHRLQGEGGNRSATEMADRLKRWADALSALTVPDGDAWDWLAEEVADYSQTDDPGDMPNARGFVDEIVSHPRFLAALPVLGAAAPEKLELSPLLVARFWEKVNTHTSSGCWEWTASRDRGGYGEYTVDGKKHRVHRLAYEMLVGPIPDGLVMDHLCRTRECVNPEHLEPVSFKENVIRGESFSAKQSRQTTCKRGHLLEGENLFESYAKAGRRKCRACASERLSCEMCGVPVRRDYLREHTRVFHPESLPVWGETDGE